jgi:hypothetical protein
MPVRTSFGIELIQLRTLPVCSRVSSPSRSLFRSHCSMSFESRVPATTLSATHHMKPRDATRQGSPWHKIEPVAAVRPSTCSTIPSSAKRRRSGPYHGIFSKSPVSKVRLSIRPFISPTMKSTRVLCSVSVRCCQTSSKCAATRSTKPSPAVR